MERATTEPIAGIPIFHEFSPELTLGPEPATPWRGSRRTDDPVVIRHRLGDAETDDLREVLSPSPSSTYYLDADDRVVVRFRNATSHVPSLMLRTTREGHEFEARYPRQPVRVGPRGRPDFSAVAFALGQRRRGFFVHSCGFLLPSGSGVLCPGVSGTGKSTLARLLEESGAPVELLSDDRTIVTKETDGLRLWGSPFSGEADVIGTGDGPLKFVVFPRHGAEMSARTVTRRDASRRLLDTLALPLWDHEQLSEALGTLDQIVSTTQLIETSYPPTVEAATWLVDLLCRADS